MDPASFTFENLSEMKFNDLYKMTVQFNLVKRRVKKVGIDFCNRSNLESSMFKKWNNLTVCIRISEVVLDFACCN